tara:strand:+ start:2034 stop:2330 length:297 start_codon:yes stop_codon:yes gene_type:complete
MESQLIMIGVAIIFIVLIMFYMFYMSSPPKFSEEIKNKYIKGYVASGEVDYNSLNKAKAACLQTDDCKGITEKDNVYTLRAGNKLMNSRTGESSWQRL